MFTPGKIVPVIAVLIFVGALVSILWGDVLGVTDLLRTIPTPVVLAIAIAAIVISIWQARRRPKL